MNQISHFYRRNGKNCKNRGRFRPQVRDLAKTFEILMEDSQVGSILAKVSTEYWQ